jgi:enoyl-CoA hydratase
MDAVGEKHFAVLGGGLCENLSPNAATRFTVERKVMSYECFDLTVAEGIAHIRFNRPDKANSMIPSFWSELPEAVNALSRDASARVIVLSAEGRHFSSGMDISVFTEGGLDGPASGSRFVRAEAFRHHCMELQDAFTCLEEARMPVLVAIQGAAVGGAMDLITACDCRYATRDAFFSVHETAIGMTADVGTYPRLVKLIPEGWARQMSYTAERVGAEKARDIGLVNEVYDTAEQMLEAVMIIAKQIAGHAPLAVSGAKRMVNYARDHTTADGLDYIATWNASMLDVDAIRSSYTAQAEGEKPQYDALLPVKKTAGE